MSKIRFFYFYHWNCGFENWLFLPCLHPCSPSCSSPSLSSLLCSFLSSLGLLLPLLLAILTLLLSKPSFHNTFENWSFCVSMCMALPEARGTIPLLLAIQKLGSANSPSWFLQQIHRLALPGDAGGPEDHGQAGPLESQSKAWTATPSPPRTCSPVWPAHLTRHSPENLERHFALVRLSDWASWGLLSPELSSPSYWGFQLQFPHSPRNLETCCTGSLVWLGKTAEFQVLITYRWSVGSVEVMDLLVVDLLSSCWILVFGHQHVSEFDATPPSTMNRGVKPYDKFELPNHESWNCKPQEYVQKWDTKPITTVVSPLKQAPIFGFSPHYCVGFLFFAWIPPLSSAAVRRRAALTTSEGVSEWVKEWGSEWGSEGGSEWVSECSLTHSLTAAFCVAGAIHRASSRSCGERGRRWPAAAFCVAGAVQRSSSRSCRARGHRWPAAAFCVAGAVHRASWRSCGARGRRWPAAAFCVAGAVHGELRRAWPPLARGCLLRVRRSIHRASWTSCGARGRRWGRGCLSRGRRSTQSLLDELPRVWPPLEPRLPFAWQVQYTQLPGGAAARVAAAGPRLPLAWQAQYTKPPGRAAARVAAAGAAAAFRVAGAVHRASWRSCGARGRRCLSRGRRSTQELLLPPPPP